MISMSLMLTGKDGKVLNLQYMAPMAPRVSEHIVMNQTTYIVAKVEHHIDEGTSMFLHLGTVVFASAEGLRKNL